MKMNSNRLIILLSLPPPPSNLPPTSAPLAGSTLAALDNTDVSLEHPYIFPSTSRRPGNDVQERVGQVAIVIEGVVSASQGDVAEIPAEKKRVKNTLSK